MFRNQANKRQLNHSLTKDCTQVNVKVTASNGFNSATEETTLKVGKNEEPTVQFKQFTKTKKLGKYISVRFFPVLSRCDTSTRDLVYTGTRTTIVNGRDVETALTATEVDTKKQRVNLFTNDLGPGTHTINLCV
jgi:hypothetical protein